MAQQPNGHTGRDTLLGGIVGHEGGHGHTLRDAAVGGMAGHISKDNKEERADAGVTGQNQGVGGKIQGGLDKMMGKEPRNTQM